VKYQFSLVLLLLCMFGCASTIQHVRFNPEYERYEGTTRVDTAGQFLPTWVVLRHPITSAVLRETNTSDSLLAVLQAGQFTREELQAPVTHSSVFQQYAAGVAYFNGIRAFRASQFVEAEQAFRTALQQDPGLRDDSDVYYQLARTYQAHQYQDRAQAAMDTFRTWAAQSLPPSFYFDDPPPAAVYRRQLHTPMDSLTTALPATHFASGRTTPRLYPRTYPGFLRGPYRHPWLNIDIAVGSTPRQTLRWHLEGQLRVRPAMELVVGQFFESGPSTIYSGVRYQAYRSPSNRVGVMPSLFIIRQVLTFSDEVEIPMFQLNPNIEDSAVEGMTTYTIWNRPAWYGGATVFLFDDVGLTLRYMQFQGFRVGVYLHGLQLFPTE